MSVEFFIESSSRIQSSTIAADVAPTTTPSAGPVSQLEVQVQTARLVHDLRTPLNAMLGAASLMRFTTADVRRPEPERLLDMIETAGRHMLRLVAEVLQVSLVQDRSPPVRPKRVDVRKMLRESLDMVEPLAVRKNLRLLLDVKDTVPTTATLDPVRIQQVLMNLLGNAIRFTDVGLIELTVEDDAHNPQVALRFDVRDTGVGMREDDMLRLIACVLNDEHTPASIVRRDGSGLGLHACQGILKAMDSRLNMASAPQSGTRVWFTVPVPPSSPASAGEHLR